MSDLLFPTFRQGMIHPLGGKLACNIILAFAVADKIYSVHFPSKWKFSKSRKLTASRRVNMRHMPAPEIGLINSSGSLELHFVDEGIDLALAPAGGFRQPDGDLLGWALRF